MSTQIKKLHDIIDPIADSLGYEIVRIALLNSSQGDGAILQVMAERSDGTMRIEDCVKLSREISVILDVEDPISENYSLEVSTPGLDRPLTRRKDFEKYAGCDIKIELSAPEDGRRRFRGTLLGITGNIVKIKVDGIVFDVNFDNINRSKIVLTDELLVPTSRQ